MSTISSVSSSGNAWAALATQRQQHQAKMFAKVDTDGSGSVDQTELSSMLSDISARTGTSLGDSKELFSKMDSNGDGSLSSDELDQGMKALMPPPSTMDFAESRSSGATQGSSAAQAPMGPPPARGPGGAGDAGATSATSSSSTFDPLDINQDGTVSEMERLAGALKQLAQTTDSDSSADSSANSEIAKLAQKLYEQISSSLLSNSSNSNSSSNGNGNASQLSATA